MVHFYYQNANDQGNDMSEKATDADCVKPTESESDIVKGKYRLISDKYDMMLPPPLRRLHSRVRERIEQMKDKMRDIQVQNGDTIDTEECAIDTIVDIVMDLEGELVGGPFRMLGTTMPMPMNFMTKMGSKDVNKPYKAQTNSVYGSMTNPIRFIPNGSSKQDLVPKLYELKNMAKELSDAFGDNTSDNIKNKLTEINNCVRAALVAAASELD